MMEWRKKIRRIFVLGLAAMLVGTAVDFSVFGMTALASGGTVTVDVAETKNLAEGYYKIDAVGNISEGQESDYNIHFNQSTNTLTLKDITLGGAKISDSVLETVNKRAGIAVANGA